MYVCMYGVGICMYVPMVDLLSCELIVVAMYIVPVLLRLRNAIRSAELLVMPGSFYQHA